MFGGYRCFNLFQVYAMASLALCECQVTMDVECNQNVSMKCVAITDNKHRSITWYKLHNRTGIIKRSDNKNPERYDYHRPAWFGDNDSLVLARVRPEDAGVYECLIRANIGQTNRKSEVILNVTLVCEAQTTMTATVEKFQNVTQRNPRYHTDVLDLVSMCHTDVSTIWTSCGFLIMGLVKIALSIISIKVVGKIKKSYSQRNQPW
ncbi:hypothetical protein DPEC_G00011560 [Dallia pectoralis]|uniref:Uncharacterized protein n=1 Tax=Dallia pectoralis TaxID=75939 RepID=A0ACC2HLG4_DALPE|nr:hypothetical protein DPEC_G00011560 [Dallia pectoralis]